MAEHISSQALGGTQGNLYRIITFSSSAALQPPLSVSVQLSKLRSSYSNSQNIFRQQELLYNSCTKHQESDAQHLLYFPSP